jgi:large subunit ribosomal protein L6
MSRLVRKPISIPEGVEVKLDNKIINVNGKLGKLEVKLLPWIECEITGDGVRLWTEKKHIQACANVGTNASILKNAIEGVSSGYSKVLKMEGVGFKSNVEGSTLVLNVGFSHQVKFPIPENIKIEVEKNTIIKLSGFDKALIGQTAAKIRKVKKPEPYKGKGIRYENEIVRRKAGKKAAGAAA